MKRKGTAIFWGILFILAAAALLVFGLLAHDMLAGFHIWRLVVSAVLLIWVIQSICCGHSIANRLSIFIRLAGIYAILQPDICPLIGREYPVIAPWIVMIVGLLLTIAVNIIFHNSSKKHAQDDFERWTENVGAKFSENTTEGNYHRSRMTSNVAYVDANEDTVQIYDNRMGELTIHYQNTDGNHDVQLEVHNFMGQVNIVAPYGWTLINKADNFMSNIIDRRGKTDVITGTITLTGENKMGEICIK